MSQPSSRKELLDYCLRKLGAPVLEVNVDEDQLNDRLDDALQYFYERHFDGIERVFLKHKLTANELNIIQNQPAYTTGGSSSGVTTAILEEPQNFIPLPDSVVGVNMVFKLDSSTVSGGMFNIVYQMFLNDLYYQGSIDILNYSMTKQYLAEINYTLTPDVQLRFNKKQHRLYLDINWARVSNDSYLIIDCYRIVDPSNYPAVYNDYWLKRYLSASIKKQWGQNITKFNNVVLPGGITMNGEKIYADGEKELEEIERQLRDEYELPPMGLTG